MQETAKKRKKRGKRNPKWKRLLMNHGVYVTGLPEDISLDELFNHFKNAGAIMEDLETGLPKIKIYTNADGSTKGDALLYFEKVFASWTSESYLLLGSVCSHGY